MSCHQQGYPWPSLATSPYRSSPLAGLQGYIPYPHIAAVCMFELVELLLLGHMWGSIVLYSHVPYHNDTINNRRRKTSLTIFTSHFIARVRKGLLKICVWEGAGDRTELQYFDPHSYGRHVVSFLFSWCSTGGPEAHSAGWWLPLLHLICNFSGPQTPSGFPRAPSAGYGFPYHISSLSDWNSNWNLTSVLTELYNSSTPTRSPTWSLKSHV